MSSIPSPILPPHLRYQFKPSVGSSHWWAINHLSTIPTSAKVLDVGSGSGALGKVLKGRGVSDLSAVEIDAEAREHVKDIYKTVAPSIDSFRGEQFDVVLLLDVLEHMANPADFLKELLTLVAPGGLLLISVPNVAHWSIRLSLLFGCFTYASRGILDKTHLQFFTRNRFHTMIRESGLSIEESSCSLEPVELLLPSWAWDNELFRMLGRLRLWWATLLPGLMGFQSLVVAKKKNRLDESTS